jgi:hypothetical protein
MEWKINYLLSLQEKQMLQIKSGFTRNEAGMDQYVLELQLKYI